MQSKAVTWVGVLLAGGGFTLALAVQEHLVMGAVVAMVGTAISALGQSLLGSKS